MKGRMPSWASNKPIDACKPSKFGMLIIKSSNIRKFENICYHD